LKKNNKNGLLGVSKSMYFMKNSDFILSIVYACVLFFHSNVQSQKKESYNWLFGARVGMTWNTTQTIGGLSGLPTPYYGSAMTNQNEGVFCMSDSLGNLLFYSDGMTIWNKNHVVMQNGSGLTGHNSSVQSGIVIPYPNQNNLYIAFTIGLAASNDLSYSLIDMSLNGGLGGVSSKNIQLTGAMGRLSENVSAVKHANGNDYWVIAVGKGMGTASAMNVWLVTALGVQTNCFASYTLPANTNANAAAYGYLCFSAHGRYFTWAENAAGSSNNFFFGEFDPATGTFPTLKVMNPGHDGYGVEFSPSCEILYIVDRNSTTFHAYKFQDLLASPTPGSMAHFTQIVPASDFIFPLQLGPDGRIYSTVYNTTDMVVIDNVNDYNNITATVVKGLLPTDIGYQAKMGLPKF
jgi:hypothetical protein